jgi:hypothetical protein
MSEVKHISGEAGGYLVGRRHSNGGIKAINKSTGQPLEMEGGEVVITRDAVSDPEKRSFNGKMMTNREILSAINQSGGGVAFEEGGEVPESMHFDMDSEFEYGGATMCGCDIAQQMSKSYSLPKFDEGGIIELTPDWGIDKDSKIIQIKDSNGNWKGQFPLKVFETDYQKREAWSKETPKEFIQKIVDVLGSETPKFLYGRLTNPTSEFVKSHSIEITIEFDKDGSKKEVRLLKNLLSLFDVLQTYELIKTKEDLERLITFKISHRETSTKVLSSTLSKDSTSVDYNFQYDLKIKQIGNLGYEDLLVLLLTEYNQTLISVSAPNKDELLHEFFAANKLYFLGFFDNLVFNFSKENTQNFNEGILETKPNEILYVDSTYVSKPSNNTSDVIKSARELKNKNAKIFGFNASRVDIASISGVSRVYSDTAYVLGNKIPKEFSKWEWWKDNFFSQASFRQRILYYEEPNKQAEWVFEYKNLDFTPYESDFVIFNPKRKTGAMLLGIQEKLSQLFENPVDVKVSTGRFRNEFYSFGPKEIEQLIVEVYYKRYVYFKYKLLQPTIFTDYIDIYPERVFFNTEAQKFFYFTNSDGRMVIELDKGVLLKKKGEEEQALKEAQEKSKAEKEAKKKEEAEKKAAQEAIKNRGYKVRDQESDFQQLFLNDDPRASLTDEILKNEKELQASLKLLSLSKGLPLSALKRKLLIKIRQLSENGANIDSYLGSDESGTSEQQKLVTPVGLMTYYYNQARQSPISKMGEACGYPTPSGEPSELDIQAYFAVRTRYFKKWFGDWEEAYESKNYANCSTLINPQTGEPRVMYHGVRKFIKGLQTGAMGSGVVRPYGEFKAPKFPATYFGDSLDYVEFYAGEAQGMPKPSEDYEGFIYSVFINMRNPIRLEGLGMEASYKDVLAYIAIKYGLVLEPSKNISEKYSGGKLKVWNFIRTDINLITTLKKFGYDGIIQYGDVPEFTNGVPTGSKVALEYLVFNPTQVKSAVVKNSFYTRFFNDIRFKKGGYVRL